MFDTMADMISVHDIIANTLFSLSPLVRDILIFVMSYAEGLPVIGTIVPGGTVAIIIGSLAEEGFIKPWVAINLIAVGSFLGDVTGFVFGKYLRKFKVVKKFLENEHHEKKWDVFDRHIALVIIFGKLIPVVRSTPSLFAGARNINKKKYLLYVLIGSYLWSVVGIFGGKALAQVFGKNAIPIIIAFVIAVAVGLWARSVIVKRNKKKSAIIPTQNELFIESE